MHARLSPDSFPQESGHEITDFYKFPSSVDIYILEISISYTTPAQ